MTLKNHKHLLFFFQFYYKFFNLIITVGNFLFFCKSNIFVVFIKKSLNLIKIIILFTDSNLIDFTTNFHFLTKILSLWTLQFKHKFS